MGEDTESAAGETAQVTTETVVNERTIVMRAEEWETFQNRMSDLETRLAKVETNYTTPTPLPETEPEPAAQPAAEPAPELTVENNPTPQAKPSKRQARKRRVGGKLRKR